MSSKNNGNPPHPNNKSSKRDGSRRNGPYDGPKDVSRRDGPKRGDREDREGKDVSRRRRGRGGRGRGRKFVDIDTFPTAPETIARLQRPLDDGDYIVFDIETTGGNPEKNGITEVFAIKWSGGEIRDTFYSLVNPGIPIPPIVRRMTGINNQMVRNAPRIEEVMPGLVSFIGNDVLVSHNTIGDMKFIRYFAQTAAGVSLDNFYLCTHLLVEKLAPEAPDKSLKGLAEHFKLAKGELHRAEADAYVTLALFKVLLRKLKERDVRRMDEAVRLQGDMESGMRLGWGIKKHALTNIPSGPGLFYLYDYAGKVLFLSSALQLDREVAKLHSFQQLPRQILRLALRSYDIKAEQAPNAFAAMLLEAESACKHRLAVSPALWHQRQIQAIVIAEEQGQLRLSVGPLTAGTRWAFGPVRDRKQASELLDAIGEALKPEAFVRLARDGLVVAAEVTSDLLALFAGRLNAEINLSDKAMRSWSLWLQPKRRKSARERLERLKRLSGVPLQAQKLSPLHAHSGVLFVPDRSVQDVTMTCAYIIAGARPRGTQSVAGDLQSIARDQTLVGQLMQRVALESKQLSSEPLTAQEADAANATLWWVFNGRHESRFVASDLTDSGAAIKDGNNMQVRK